MKKNLESKLDQIDAMLEEIDAATLGMYQDLIEMHQSERLRSAAEKAGSFEIVKKDYKTGRDALSYTKNGFEAFTATYYSSDGYGGAGYAYWNHKYSITNGRLLYGQGDSRRELLEMFPSLTVESIEDAIIEGIDKMKLYKRAKGRKKK